MEDDDPLKPRGIRPIMPAGFAPPSADELQALTILIGHDLPADLVNLVARYGCSSFAGLASVRSLPDGKLRPIAILYGGGKPGHNLLSNTKAYRGRMPPTAVPFARDGFGNQFCVDLRAAGVDPVYFWDHEDEADPMDYEEQGLPVPPDLLYSNMTMVALSLRDFIDRIELNTA